MKKTLMLAGALGLSALAFALLAVSGSSIWAESFATNATNVLDSDTDYAVLNYSTSAINCPTGFDKNGSVCDLNGTKIRGWLAVDFTPSSGGFPNGYRVDINHSDFDLNCTDCNQGVAYKVFTAPSLSSKQNIVWTYRGECTVTNQTYAGCFVNVSGSIESVLLGRSDYPQANGNPAISYVRLLYNETQCSNGIDDDFDGNTDYPADLQCSSYADTNEWS